MTEKQFPDRAERCFVQSRAQTQKPQHARYMSKVNRIDLYEIFQSPITLKISNHHFAIIVPFVRDSPTRRSSRSGSAASFCNKTCKRRIKTRPDENKTDFR